MSARFFLIWLCVVSSVFGGENFEPKDALLFVEGLKSQEVIDWDDYVLASHLDELQLKELKERVKAQVDERFKEDYEFSILDSRQDGDIGGVIFKLKSPSDPVFLDVVGLSFCRLGEDWKITPLMGRYIYTGFKLYNEEAEKRQKLMEDWILRNLRKQRSLLEGKLENDFRKEILAKLDKEGPLFKGSRDEALLYFLSLCKKKDFYGLAGCLGLDDFEGRSGYTEAKLSLLDGFKGGKNSGGWHRLVDKIYLMAPMEKVGDEDDKVSLAMYYPLESDPQQILEMDVKKINDRWIVFLSKEMLLRSTGRFGSTRFGSWRLSKENRDRLEDVSSLILKSLKSKRSEKVEDLLSKLEASLKGNDIKLWCEIGNFDFDDNDKALLALDESVSMWTGLRTSKNTVMKVLKTDVDGGVAFNHLLVFSKTRPNEHELHRLIFIRGEQGWFLATEKWIDELEADDVVSKNYEALLALQNDREEEFKKEVSRSLLGEAVIINGEEAVKFSMPRKGELIKKYKEYQFYWVQLELICAERWIMMLSMRLLESFHLSY